MARRNRGPEIGDVTPTPGRRALSEGAHKLDPAPPGAAVPTAAADRPGVKRNFNEAAHKLGQWPVRPAPVKDTGPSEAIRAASDDDRDVVAHASRAVLALGALGIVYGDLGTSPLYTEQVIFTAHRNAAQPTPAGVYGIISLIF